MSVSLRRLIAEHRVRGQGVLPGAALLEMARAAAARAAGAPVTALEAVTFVRPALPGARVALDVSVERGTFAVRDARGELARGRFSVERGAGAAVAPMGPAEVTEVIDPARLYAWYAEVGLEYGPAFRVIRALRRGAGVLRAELSLSPELRDPALELHPCALDGALHALGALAFGTDDAALHLPFAVDRLRIHGALDADVVVEARVASRAGDVAKADLWISARDGEPRVTVEGLCLKAIPRIDAAPVFVPSWRAAPAAAGGARGDWWVVGDAPAGFGAALGALRLTVEEARARVAHGAPAGLALFPAAAAARGDAEGLLEDLAASTSAALALLAALPAGSRAPRVVVFADAARPRDEALTALARVLRLEAPSTHARAVLFRGASVAALEAELGADEPEVRLDGDVREVPAEAALAPATAARPARGVVALITGGLGGLGLETARWLWRRYGARLALLGRAGAPAGTPAAAAVDALRAEGAQVWVGACDVAEVAALARAVDAARQALGPIGLVVHAAGVTRDALLAAKSPDAVREVLRPKVLGLLHLDALLARDPVAHTILYSSVVSLVGNYGQADYAVANRFLDAWARRARGEGRSVVSVNWGPWAEVGMAKALAEHARRAGVVPLRAAAALEALERVMGAGVAQAAVVERVDASGARAEPPIASLSAPIVAPSTPTPAHTPPVAAHTAQALEGVLLDELSRVLEVDRRELDPETNFRDFGLDSILGAQLVKELERRLGVAVPPSLFFEATDARALAARLAALVPAPPAIAPDLAAPREAEAAPAAVDTANAPTSSAPSRAPAAPPPARDRGPEPIAVVGYALRAPGASSAAALHALLESGVSPIREVPADRWPLADHYDPNPDAPGKTYARQGAFLDDVDRFDPLTYGISPREAARMDPVQRVLLDLSREALEHAGLGPRLHGSATGVFVGGAASEYGQRFVGAPERIDGHTGTGTAGALLAGRLSHAFDLRGPSLTIDTACSSGLVALHLAMESLRRDECEAALVGACNLLLGPETFVAFAKGRLLSPSGRPRPFAPDADGYVRAEAGVVLLLMPASRAEALGCTVYGLLRGSAVAQDGRTRGLTLPSVEGEIRALSSALSRAEVPASALRYVEAHAVGSAIGDRTELEAIARVTGGAPCTVGAHKGQLGHAEVASGLLSLAKLLGAFSRGAIPASAGLSLPPEARAQGLAPCDAPLPVGPGFVAAVNAFGFGGTTAAVVVEAPPAAPSAAPPAEQALPPRAARPLVLALSARGPEPLAALIEAHRASLASEPSIEDACFTANSGRPQERWRLAVSAPSRDGLLAALAAAPRPTGAAEGAPRVAFLFTGQGAQYAGMGRELYAGHAAFRAALDRCAAVADPLLPVPLRAAMFEGTRLDDTALTQPALFAFEWAMAELWRAAGVEPAAVIGHSVGELVAAAVAGALSLEDALTLTVARGRAISALPAGGAMLAVSAPAEAVAELADDVELSIAAINAPGAVVLSGLEAAVARAEQALRGRGVRTRRLTVSHAFHSSLMDPMLAELGRAAAGVRVRAPERLLVSNVSGAAASALDAAHWVRHVRAPVRFMDGVRALAARGPYVWVEVGPDGILARLARATLGADAAVLASVERGRAARETLALAGAALFERGADVDFAALETERRRRVAVPLTPVMPRRLWIERASAGPQRVDAPQSVGAQGPAEHGPPSDAPPIAAPPSAPAPRGGADVEAFLITEVARVLELAPAEVDPRRPVGELGLDSVVGLEIASRLEAAFAVEVELELVAPDRSIRDIAAALGALLAGPAPSGPAPSGPAPLSDRASARASAPPGPDAAPRIIASLPAVDPADYAQYGRPALLARLSAAALDKSFVEARGDRVWFEEDGQRHEVLDMLGGFGSTLFGHNHPELVATAHAMLERGVIHHAQGSVRTAAGTLGRKLSERLERLTGRPFVSTFLNSGAEALEAAIKHAQLEYSGRADALVRARHKRDACLLHDLGAAWRLPDGVRAELSSLVGRDIPARLDEAIALLRAAEDAIMDRRPAFLALERSFHGKTAATSLLTANPGYRSRYTEGIRVLRTGTSEQLAEHLAAERHERVWLTEEGGQVRVAHAPWASVAAAFVEPVQGEGGVRPLERARLADLRRAADTYGFPVVADEVQAGFGRCGAFSASAALGLAADYYAFGKSLGGGLSKISVLCVAADRHQADFDLFHTSTFAEDDASALLGLRALEIYDRDGLESRAERLGQQLMSALWGVQRRHPTVIREVRGMGLLVGIELCDLSASPSAFIRLTEENLGNLAAAWFLHVERIRFLPTSSATHTLRLEPSAYVSEADLARVVAAFDRFCTVIERGNVAHLLAPLVGEAAPEAVRDWSGERPPERITALAGERRVAFVTYFVEPEDLVRWAPAMGELSASARTLLLERLHRVIEPRVFRSARIESRTRERVLFEVFGLMSTSEIIEQAMRAGDLEWIRAQIDDAVGMAIDNGAQVVGFGGLTSIVTRNCRLAATDRAALTTGNALTVAMGLEAMRRAAAQSGIDVAHARLGVVGAAGNIGETYARVMAEASERLLLVGRPGGRARLEQVADRLYDDAVIAALAGSEAGLARAVRGTRAFAEGLRGEALRHALARELVVPPVVVSERMEDLRTCGLILSASNSARPIIHPPHVGAGPVVICDVAVPPDVSPEVAAMPGVRVVTGGAVQLPNDRDLDLCMGHLPRGHVYACMAETLLLGLEGRGAAAGHFSFGPIEKERVREAWALAQKHGFGLEAEGAAGAAAADDERPERHPAEMFDVAQLN